MDNLTEILETIKNSFNRDQSTTESHIANLRVAIDSLKDNEGISFFHQKRITHMYCPKPPS